MKCYECHQYPLIETYLSKNPLLFLCTAADLSIHYSSQCELHMIILIKSFRSIETHLLKLRKQSTLRITNEDVANIPEQPVTASEVQSNYQSA